MNATMTNSTMKANAAMSARAFVSAVVFGSEQVFGQKGFIGSTDCKHGQNEGNDEHKSDAPGNRVN